MILVAFSGGVGIYTVNLSRISFHFAIWNELYFVLISASIGVDILLEVKTSTFQVIQKVCRNKLIPVRLVSLGYPFYVTDQQIYNPFLLKN